MTLTHPLCQVKCPGYRPCLLGKRVQGQTLIGSNELDHRHAKSDSKLRLASVLPHRYPPISHLVYLPHYYPPTCHTQFDVPYLNLPNLRGNLEEIQFVVNSPVSVIYPKYSLNNLECFKCFLKVASTTIFLVSAKARVSLFTFEVG